MFLRGADLGLWWVFCVLVQVLQNIGTTTMATYADAQKIVETILAVTELQLPPHILAGRQCIPDTNAPIRTGITCDIYAASFLSGEKVAKKMFRIGMSEKNHVRKYAEVPCIVYLLRYLKVNIFVVA